MLLALPYPTMSFLPFYVAEDVGFFSRNGVAVHCIHVRETKEKKVRLALAGDLSFFTSVNTAVEALLRGWGEVKALCANTVTLNFCMVWPNIRDLQDLKGKTVMVGGGASNDQIRYLCKEWGWEAGKDIIILRGSALDRVRAFQDPSISAIIAREEYTYWALKAGFRLIKYPEDYMRWHGDGLCTSVRFVQEKPDLAYRTVRAVLQATNYTNKHREAAVAVAAKRIKDLSREEIEGNYEIVQSQGGYNCDITADGVRYMSKVLALVKGSTKKIALSDVADMSFLEKARLELQSEA